MHVRAKRTIVLLSALHFSLLAGCFSARGVEIEPRAYFRVHPSYPQTRLFDLRGYQWHTGNAHMPLDFTVYRYPLEYEVRVHAPNGTLSPGDFEVYLCGRKIESPTGTIVLSDERMTLDLQYPPNTQKPEVQHKLKVSARVVSLPPPPNKCPRPFRPFNFERPLEK